MPKVTLSTQKKKRQDETQFTTQIDGFLSHPPPLPPLNAKVFFCRFFLNLTLCMTKLRVQVLCLSYFADNSNIKVIGLPTILIFKMESQRLVLTIYHHS
jgi:hypothetical protein